MLNAIVETYSTVQKGRKKTKNVLMETTVCDKEEGDHKKPKAARRHLSLIILSRLFWSQRLHFDHYNWMKSHNQMFDDCCIFWPAFWCCSLQTMVQIFTFNICHAEKLKNAKKQQIRSKICQKNRFLTLHHNASFILIYLDR